ncbi:hypothetical protein EDB85DRAFT_2151970 [Lactarius pseudohatsudake]|nr:hypothetical protein EDB85DRAFT_2151970 [Lactarius pseudohatsudake]
MSLPTTTVASSLSAHGVDNLSHQELATALVNTAAIEDVNNPDAPAAYWLFDGEGQCVSTIPYSIEEIQQLQAIAGGSVSASPSVTYLPATSRAPRIEDMAFIHEDDIRVFSAMTQEQWEEYLDNGDSRGGRIEVSPSPVRSSGRSSPSRDLARDLPGVEPEESG